FSPRVSYGTERKTVKREDMAIELRVEERLIVYTDGSKRAHRAGIGIFFGDDHPLNSSIPLDVVDSGTAEIIAVHTALVMIWSWKMYKCQDVVVRTDYMGVIDAMQGRTRRAGRHAELYDNLRKVAERFPSVTFEYVRGHSGVKGNEMADMIAKAASGAVKKKTEWKRELEEKERVIIYEEEERRKGSNKGNESTVPSISMQGIENNNGIMSNANIEKEIGMGKRFVWPAGIWRNLFETMFHLVMNWTMYIF
ncbi:hypothetical protein PMAYCL1PPCAC_29603, partial [Pristionchus mayeri]